MRIEILAGRAQSAPPGVLHAHVAAAGGAVRRHRSVNLTAFVARLRDVEPAGTSLALTDGAGSPQ